MKKLKSIAKMGAFTFFLLMVLPPAVASQLAFQVIVNSKNTLDNIESAYLTDVYLKKSTHWPNSDFILPVDLEPESLVRKKFSEEILKRPIAAVRSYWQQLIFSGRGVPPPELKTDQDVVNFVSLHSEAIGYVSMGANLNGVKVISVK
jgi:ABC-type phosphate transport system substrate-binding protein